MRIKIFTMAVATSALALGAPMAKAMPVSSLSLEAGLAKAHAVRVCEEDGDCWWTWRHPHSRYWDEERRGERSHEDYYGRAPHREFDRDNDRDRDERHGRMENDRQDTAKAGKENRGGKEGGVKEHGRTGGATTTEPGQTQQQGAGGKKE